MSLWEREYIHRGKAMGRHSEKWSFANQEEKASPETNIASTLILNFQCPEYWENIFCCLSHKVCGVLLWQPKQTNADPQESADLILRISALDIYLLSPSLFLRKRAKVCSKKKMAIWSVEKENKMTSRNTKEQKYPNKHGKNYKVQ